MPAIGAAAWIGGLAGLLGPPVGVGITLAIAAAALWWARPRLPRPWWRFCAAVVVVVGSVAAVAMIRVGEVAGSPVTALGARSSSVTATMVVSGDPRISRGRYSDLVVLRARMVQVSTRAASYQLSTPVLVLGGESWTEVALGSTVRASGRLEAAEGEDLAAVLRATGDPRPVAPPRWWWRGAEVVRASLSRSVADLPDHQRALVPALVVGDDSRLDDQLAEDFKTTGLTHLLAVSGTNLTLLVGFLLWIARWAGVRGRASYVVGAFGIIGFILLARPEPSVLRAAVMGAVGLVALGPAGSRSAGRALGVAVTALLLIDPWLAMSPGFALSALATAGIVFWAPGWRDALAAWLPGWAAEAVAVPAAAQWACTPIVAALSGQVSLVAVGANLFAAPVVGPATVLGLGGGLVGLVWGWAGGVIGRLAGWCVAWIVTVAHHGASVPLPAVGWGTGPLALALLSVLSVLALVAAPRLLRRRFVGVLLCVGLVMTVLVRPSLWGWLPQHGWPPEGWVIVACDVGQGDAVLLNAGRGRAVVIDAGPDPASVDRCLTRLRVDRIPLVVLTHYHADHVTGLPGVLDGRAVGRIEVTPLTDPPEAARQVADQARSAGLEPVLVPYGAVEHYGEVTVRAVWPPPDQPTVGPGDGSTANDASVVLVAEVRGIRLLLTGDLEPNGQEAVARELPGLTVDILKVPHHGSPSQDLPFLTSLHARVALISVGADNDYGHPAARTVDALTAAGARVLRTDLGGDLAVVERNGQLYTVTSRR